MVKRKHHHKKKAPDACPAPPKPAELPPSTDPFNIWKYFNFTFNKLKNVTSPSPKSTVAAAPVLPDYPQLYRDAERNMEDYPYQLGLAAYNVQEFKGGDASYNAFINNVLDDRSKKIVNKIKQDFSVQYNRTKELIEHYNTNYINSRYIIDTYYEYLSKNAKLTKDLTNSQNNIAKNGRKVFYQGKNIQGMQRVENYVRMAYRILCFVCLVALFFYVDPTDMSIYTKGAFAFAFLAYPFLIHPILPLLFWFFSVCHSIYDYFVHRDIYSYAKFNVL